MATILKLKAYDNFPESKRSINWKYTICLSKRSLDFETIRSFCWKYTIIKPKVYDQRQSFEISEDRWYFQITDLIFSANDRLLSVMIVYFTWSYKLPANQIFPPERNPVFSTLHLWIIYPSFDQSHHRPDRKSKSSPKFFAFEALIFQLPFPIADAKVNSCINRYKQTGRTSY